ncbi:hypothetical protein [Marinomonas mediterranea]|uniref:Uncharacterized protein n=1 Tax=Marinomonas mediterranea (strain ATCC 700492 / JCM 21426 / NBRC 103028 / MMB-1) TaxID=717774 RepID=F2JYK3_MARM1|nr:hypothetical protein [Marinomonas mediterranea]ADZ93132.1 hypothetical protein Marme_3922 [Marinomonas mediterranea MMB-1]WCN11039.1 hypothetical protein GV055_19925 [Marinomonas mediterranea]WCN15097.1 hypothetical protein GV054_19800 [Marinomonas mediterranea]WCN19140.1 hypothetical protein GV053_19860 [Marinomonas mediterranea MMB-1]
MKHYFLGKFTRSDSKESDDSPEALLKGNLKNQISAVLQRQMKDANSKKAASYFWGNTGWVIEQAVLESNDIVEWLDDEDIDRYFERVLPELMRLLQKYRSSCDDPNGYGFAVINELDLKLIELARDYQLHVRPE